mmetsp:Transcript_54357/g.128375  ORF Transcript_54357/g.128375 Transcript_54357/m.128375 type:complete len:109 (-) Transcript_54357:1175-1501(-)
MSLRLDLESVLRKLSVPPEDCLNAYLVGSRLWGTARKSSDFDLIIVVKGDACGQQKHSSGVDGWVIGRSAFEEAQKQHRMFELMCTWAPQENKLRSCFTVASPGIATL